MVDPIRPQDASGIYRRQITPSEAAHSERASGPAATGRGRRSDQINLSAGARELQRTLEAVRAQPELRAELMAALRREIADGTYRVDASAIARRMFAEGGGE